MNQQDFAKVIDEIPRLMIRKWLDEDIQMLFEILYWCALRPNEGIRLRKEDFDLESRKISLGRTKTKLNDIAPIPSVFVPKLANYLEFKEEGRLFDGLTYNSFYPWLNLILRKLEKWFKQKLKQNLQDVQSYLKN